MNEQPLNGGISAVGTGWRCGCGALVGFNETHGCLAHGGQLTPAQPILPGWKCPNCGSAHAPSVLTCPVSHTYRGAMWGATS